MVRVGQEHEEDHTTDFKSQLVLEICSISTSYVSCAHRVHIISSSNKVDRDHGPHFIDWYRVLGVGEDAEMDVVRKRYHKLALLLHPDKNKHPKSETAFKLISEAYTCLSDSAKRRAFNLKRWKDFCIECNKIPYTNCKLSPIQPTHSSKHKAWKPANWPSKSYKFLRNLRDIKERFKEEARVIEHCLSSTTTTTASSRQEPSLVHPSENLFRSNTLDRIRKESPIFDPSDYIFQGYPHLRNRINGKPDDCWYFHKENTQKCKQGRGMPDTPIFENRTDKGRMFKSKSTCVRS
ncbi:hypothetical protein EZV62_000242 [Acer yangbiense]|uniref:J domain-containing protein n=1 Tax=Acer yangbiense TaxID=1000413 RepID=A0A5C7IQK2_9ROSI|nr:hypothetical protein EZV62_000242 [Acer yangbiense]